MNTPIGQSLRARRPLAMALMALAFMAVAADMWLFASGYADGARALLAIAVLGCYVLSGGVDRISLGLRIAPVQPIAYWIRTTVVVALLMLVPILACVGIATWLRWDIPIPRIPPDQALSRLVQMCVIAPVLEESIYRLALCVPTTATIGSTGCILISGAVFAALHFVYGNPGPDNFVAGYILAWAYLKSGSIVVPTVLHSLGNAVAFAAQIGAWYVM